MRLLLDTHAFLWFTAGDTRLSRKARQAIEDPGNEKFVSLVSCWEITIKFTLGRLEVSVPLDELLDEAIEGNGLAYLEVDRKQLLELPRLASTHGDPFDRLLVAQAKVEGLTLVSNDRVLDAYQVARIW